MIALCLALALAQDPLDVRESIAAGATVNWTTLTLEVTQIGQGRGVAATRRALEASARSGLGEQVRSAVNAIHVAPGVDVADLLEDPTLGETVSARSSRWAVGEARYYASGRIDVVAELALIDLLKPYSLAHAVVRPDEVREPAVTGVLIDARGTGAVPAWSPRVLAGPDRVLWDGYVWADIAIDASPAVWVSDPAHVAAARVGDSPLIVRAISARGAELTLDPLDAVRFRTTLDDSDVLRSGRTVIVVDR